MAKRILMHREGTTELQATPPRSASPKRHSPKKQSSSGSNTAAFPYFDGQSFPSVCEADRKRIQDKCHTDRGVEESRASFAKARTDESQHAPDSLPVRLQRPFRRAIQAIDSVGKKKSGYERNPKNQWMEDHCTGLWIKPGGESQGGKNIQDFERQIADALNCEKEAVQKMKGEVLEKLQHLAKGYRNADIDPTLGVAGKRAAERAALSRFPTIMGMIRRMSGAHGLGELIGNVALAAVTDDMSKQFSLVESGLMEARKKLDELKKFSKGKVEDGMAATQAGVAFANPCLKARKCMLIPYKDSDKLVSGNGCCAGQTGHHVLPDAMFYHYVEEQGHRSIYPLLKKSEKRQCWKHYDRSTAPTMCLEGTTNRATNGSHGAVHFRTGKLMSRMGSRDERYVKTRSSISLMLGKAFGCDPNCINKQLDNYYMSVHECGDLSDARVTPHSGAAGWAREGRENEFTI